MAAVLIISKTTVQFKVGLLMQGSATPVLHNTIIGITSFTEAGADRSGRSGQWALGHHGQASRGSREPPRR